MIDTLTYIIGWTLLHSVWQGAIIAAVAAVLIAVIPRSSAQARYNILCAALLVHVCAPIVTAIALSPRRTALSSLASASVTSAGARPATAPASRSAVEQLGADRQALPRSTLAEISTLLASQTRQVERFLPYLAGLWLAGVLVGLVRRTGGWLLLRRLIARATPATGPIVHRARELARVMSIRRAVRIVVSDSVDGPFTTGWLRPVIVMPLTMLSGLDPVHVDAIITHELAHIRRWDYLIALLQSAALTVLFHHPVTWWLDRRLRIEREYGCDDLVVATSRDRVGYVRALAELESLRLGLPSLALAATDGSLQHRAARLLGVGNQAAPAGWAPAIALVGVLVAAGAVHAATPLEPATSLTSATNPLPAASIAPASVEQGGVIRHPDPNAPFDARFAWALAQARQRDGNDEVVIGWRVRSAISDGDIIMSSTDGTSRMVGNTVASLLGAQGSQAQGVAILFTWSGGPNGSLNAVRLRDFQSPVMLDGRPLVWLHTAPDPASIGLIERLLGEVSGSSVRAELAAALSLHDDRAQVLRAVTRVFDNDRDEHVRAEALAWVGRHGGDSAVVALIRRAVDDQAPEVRDEALTALGDSRSPRSRVVLLELLNSSKYSDVRSEVVQKLARGGDEVVATLLRVAFEDSTEDVQSEAVDAIKDTPGEAAVRALRDIAQRHPDRRLRSEARDALDERGFR